MKYKWNPAKVRDKKVPFSLLPSARSCKISTSRSMPLLFLLRLSLFLLDQGQGQCMDVVTHHVSST